jgi:N-acetylglucosamine-6-phosphate deacetylase
VVASLLHDEMFVEMISDGQHLSPMMVALTLRAKPFEKAVVISDCNALTGMAAGTSMLFGKQTITVHPEGALNEEGRLAGSTMLITDCVRNLVYWGLLSFPHAVQLATHHPATHLGDAPLFGQIAVGSMADLVLWKKDDLSIDNVFLAGEPVATATGSRDAIGRKV